MKRILSFLICAIAFCANAATNTVLTTTTNRVLAISATGAQLVSSNSVTDMRTLLSVPSAASLTTVSNSVTTLRTQLPGYATNYGASLTNAAITGGTVSSQTNSDLTASRAIVSDANKKLSSSAVTSTELGYVAGVTSAIQTQLDAKATAANLTTVSNTVTTQGNTLSTNTALLNGSPIFSGPVSITNAASTISGNGVNITNISPGNIVSNGTYLANGTLATNSGAISGGFLTETGTQRAYSLNAGSLTNIPAANLTGTAGTITAAGYTATQQTLVYSSGTNVTVDATKSIHFVTLTNTTYFPTPSGIAAGQSFTVILRQDATGGRAVSFQNTWNFPSGSIPTITTNASATDVLSCVVGPYGTNVLAVHNARFQ